MACSAAPMRVTSLSGLISSIAASYSFCQFVSSMAALPIRKNYGRPCKTTKCLRHISRGLNFGGVRRHFGLPLQSSNLIGDFRSVASIRNLCCRFQRLIDGRESKATAACFKARQTILCADIFCQSHITPPAFSINPVRLGRHLRQWEEGAGAHDPTRTACHIIYVRTHELNQVFTVEGAILAAENRGKA